VGPSVTCSVLAGCGEILCKLLREMLIMLDTDFRIQNGLQSRAYHA